MSQDRDWKTLAIGMGALLEKLEAHCSVQTGKTGPAHAAEGRELREAMGSFIALVRAELSKADDSNDWYSGPQLEEIERQRVASEKLLKQLDHCAAKPMRNLETFPMICEQAAREIRRLAT